MRPVAWLRSQIRCFAICSVQPVSVVPSIEQSKSRIDLARPLRHTIATFDEGALVEVAFRQVQLKENTQTVNPIFGVFSFLAVRNDTEAATINRASRAKCSVTWASPVGDRNCWARESINVTFGDRSS